MSYQPPPYDVRNPDQLAELRAALAKAEARADIWMKSDERRNLELAVERQRADQQAHAASLMAHAMDERDALRAECERLKAEAAEVYGPTWACKSCGCMGHNFGTVAHPAGDYDLECRACGSTECDELENAFPRVVDDLDSLRATLAEREAEIERLKAHKREFVDGWDAQYQGVCRELSEARAALATARAEALEEAAKIAEAKGRASFEREVGWACSEIANAIRALASDTKGPTP